MRKMNRKGAESIATTILVFMALVLIGIALISFVFSRAVEANVADSRFLERIYLEEEKFEAGIWNGAENSIVNNYNEVAASTLQAFGGTKANMEFEIRLKNSMKIENYIPAKDETNPVNIDVSQAKTEIKVNNEIVEVNVSGAIIRELLAVKNEKRIYVWKIIPTPWKEEKLEFNSGIKYMPEIYFKFNINEIGLQDFKKINEVLVECKDKEKADEIKACISGELSNFGADVNIGGDGKKSVKFTSKKKFFINNDLKSVEFDVQI